MIVIGVTIGVEAPRSSAAALEQQRQRAADHACEVLRLPDGYTMEAMNGWETRDGVWRRACFLNHDSQPPGADTILGRIAIEFMRDSAQHSPAQLTFSGD